MRQIPVFKRRTAKLEAGDYKDAGLRGVTISDVSGQQVQIVREANEPYEEEDRYIVATDRGTIIVDGCDLNPHPKAPATNVELITHIMDWGSTAMTQAFIMNAVQEMAEKTVANKDELIAKMNGGMISGEAWVGAAEEILEALKANRDR